MLGASTLGFWQTLGRSWDAREHKKGHFEAQAWIFIDFRGSRDSILRVCWVLWNKKVYFVMLVYKFLFVMIFGSESGCLGLGNQSFGMGVVKNQLLQTLDFS